MTRIKEAKITKSSDNQANGFSTELFFFIAINVLAVGVSTYQTYIGYKADVAGKGVKDSFVIALAIALMSGILFLAMNFGIRQRRLDGQKHLWHIVMYIIPLGISFFGNFNAFYSNQTGSGFLKNEVTNYKSHLTQSHDEAIVALHNSVNINSFKQEYNSALNDLEIEFNQQPVGWGKNADARWLDLTNVLNQNGGSIDPNVISGTTGNTRFNRAKAFADLEFKNIINAKQNSVNPILTIVANEYSRVHNKIDSLVNLPNPIYNDNMLSDMVVAENNIRAQTSSFLGNNNIFSKDALKVSSESSVGTIKHTLQKAFIDKEEPSATYFSLFFSLIIDLAGLLYIVVFIPYNREVRRVRGGRMAQKI